ncbi:MAG TPA: PQQ-dependent sugar dehydrogenase [Planctomycetota bacterium]|nr:PQQ-dependent sugar dehydrogenase [Planctomycetota bacterium]
MPCIPVVGPARFVARGVLSVALLCCAKHGLCAQSMVDPGLGVATIVAGLDQPIAMAFLGPDDFLVTEKATGKVKRVTNGVVAGVVLDLAVNSASERGLLGIALHPQFPSNPGVYLYNTESTTGADTSLLDQTPLRGNRVDRFVWNGSTLTFDRNIIKLRSYQEDLNGVTDPLNPFNNPAPVLRGNHNGGVIRFGPDGKLYVIIGDNGRRGLLQNNLAGPFPDDTFGGPLPDDAHLTGVILRLADDGGTPVDNPFYMLGALVGVQIGGIVGTEVGLNIQRLFAYGIRNSFGMTFDPRSGDLWTTENGGRAFDEINHVDRGFNGGWIQSMGPLSRVQDFRDIEVGVGIGGNGPVGLQQLRWPATNIAENHHDAKNRMLHIPGSHLRDPEFSWKQVTPPAALGFIDGDGLGAGYDGDLVVGSAVFRPVAAPPSVMANPGNLYRFRLNGGRNKFQFNDPRLRDKVADNLGRDDWVTEQQEILFGTDFGIVTDIQTGPDGDLYLVSPSHGSVRKVFKL